MGRRSSRAALVALVVIVSVLAPATSVSAAPEGMVGVPADNVDEHLPGNYEGNLKADDLRGEVMASNNASSLEVVVTMPKFLDSKFRDSTAVTTGEAALILRDDRNHAGREVALPVAPLEDELGHVPEQIYGVHEDGETWSRDARVEDDSLVFEVPHFSDNVVSFEGEVSLSGTPATDGDAYSYSLADLDAASNFTVDVTGNTATEWDNQSAAGLSSGDSLAVNPAGNLAPTGPSANGEPVVRFTGIGDWHTETYTDSVDWNNGTFNGTDESGGSVELIRDGVHDVVEEQGDGSVLSYGADFIGDENNDHKYRAEFDFIPSHNISADNVTMNITNAQGSNYGPEVDIYIDEGDTDGDPTAGTLVKSGWNPEWAVGHQSVSFDSSYSVSAGQTYHISFVTTQTDSDADWDRLSIAKDDSASTGEFRAWYESGITSTDNSYADIAVRSEDGGSGTYHTATRDWDKSLPFHNATVTASIPSGDGVEATFSNGKGDTVTKTLSDGTNTYDLSGLPESSSVTVEFYMSGTGPAVGSVKVNNRLLTDSPGIDIDGDGTDEAAYSGLLNDGETVTKEITDLAVGDDSATVSTADGPVDVAVRLRERTQTVDPAVEVNGNTTSYSGALADGSTTSLSTDTAWLREGTNSVNVSVGDGTLSADAPAPLVEFTYSHGATAKISTTYESTEWEQKYNISKMYETDQAAVSATIPFADDIVEILGIETRVNGGSWSTVSDSAISTTGSETTIDLGDVAAGDEVEIRATGRRVSVANGTISVVEPTVKGADLDSEILVESTSGTLEIDVSNSDSRIHYLASSEWTSEEVALVEASGSQTLRLPNAVSGASTRIRTAPLEFAPEAGSVGVRVLSTDGKKFRLVETESAEDVSITWLEATPEETYELYSTSRERVVATSTANSPVSWLASADLETFEIRLAQSSGGGGVVGVSSTDDGGSPLSIAVLLGGFAASILGTAYVGRRWLGWTGRRGTLSLLGIGGTLGVVAVEIATSRSVVGDVVYALGDVARTEIGIVALGVLGVLAIWQIDDRWDLPQWALLLGVGAVAYYVIDTVSGGMLSSGLGEVSALVWVVVLLGGVVLLYRALKGPTIKVSGGSDT